MYFAKQHHIAVISSDWQKAREFYIEKLGFEMYREVYRPEQDDYLRMLRCGDTVRLDLGQYGLRGDYRIGWVAHRLEAGDFTTTLGVTGT